MIKPGISVSEDTLGYPNELETCWPASDQKINKDVETVYSITLTGLVQAIGFRPFVYQLAKKWNLKGTVTNGPCGVNIQILADRKIATDFLEEILSNPPALSRITGSKIVKGIFNKFKNFEIIESENNEISVSALLTPDLAMCEQCRRELYDNSNRRQRYPFITCTHCGPRYSIIQKLPYDRVNTTMQEFAMCIACRNEFNDPENRRFYSQTNSCKTCGPELFWYEIKKAQAEPVLLVSQEEILSAIKSALTNGKIVAVKGIGGYLLLCDATSENAVAILRERKHRPAKPFAVLYPDLKKLREDTLVTDLEAKLLQSPVSPVVLVKRKDRNSPTIAESVAPGLDQLGVMLPYSPLLEIIASDFQKPLVATSGNVSDSPIIFQDQKALEELADIADFILTNNRKIITPQDDSVIRFSALHQKKIILRRSRGLSPDIHITKITNSFPAQKIAFGASAKSTFCIQNGNEVNISQYHGNLANYDAQQDFEHSLNHLKNIFKLAYSGEQHTLTLLADMHPAYFSTHLAKEYAEKYDVPLRKIQHHKAHFAAVLAENDLDDDSGNVLGVIWDGTGYGTDGMIWGGEFFYKNQRLHFPYFHSLLNYKMAKEPRISSFSVFYAFSKQPLPALIKDKFTHTEWTYLNKAAGINTLKTSSIGRLFDAVASLTGLIDKTSYEGEAALLLEREAQRYFETNGYDFSASYFDKAEFLIDALISDVQAKKESSEIAAKFHYSLVKFIEYTAKKVGAKKLAFSGGVFQNAVLVDLVIINLTNNFELYFHKQLSANDENISFGQIAYINAAGI
ncbi:carbamoyltransferase HypF [Dyadobacter sp. 3J3]|uniref:carbamoyltransferase HypF n=1 Tax=Dyadobacter sp. 3J3 TaxID=2606600 RepID=UPI001E4E37EE|nr:carbamoyltransferase HypF [Dyadobacter sp. 3J3]